MALKDLRLPGKGTGFERRRYNRDIEIGINIVDRIFDEIAISMKSPDISLVAKGFIQSLVLRDKTIDGVKEFIRNMSDERAKLMIDFIEAECKKRRT